MPTDPVRASVQSIGTESGLVTSMRLPDGFLFVQRGLLEAAENEGLPTGSIRFSSFDSIFPSRIRPFRIAADESHAKVSAARLLRSAGSPG
jgi:hypothetical protein